MENDEMDDEEIQDYLRRLIILYSTKGVLKTECDVAKWDIKREKMKLYIHEGIYAIPKYEDDRVFELTYKVAYVPLGCVRKSIDYKLYNQTIFKFLDEVYGMSWRFSVRSDVIGLLPNNK